MISKKWNYVSEKWNYVEKSTQTYSRIGNTYLSELSSKQVEKMVHAIAFNSREACRRFPPVGLDSAPPYGPQQRHPVAQNLHQLEDLLLSVSHPDSPTYGQHWSPAQIVDFFSPSHEPIAAVKNWLVDSGLSPERLRLSPSRGWINVDVTVAEAEDLLRTYTHPSSGVEQFGAPETESSAIKLTFGQDATIMGPGKKPWRAVAVLACPGVRLTQSRPIHIGQPPKDSTPPTAGTQNYLNDIKALVDLLKVRYWVFQCNEIGDKVPQTCTRCMVMQGLRHGGARLMPRRCTVYDIYDRGIIANMLGQGNLSTVEMSEGRRERVRVRDEERRSGVPSEYLVESYYLVFAGVYPRIYPSSVRETFCSVREPEEEELQHYPQEPQKETRPQLASDQKEKRETLSQLNSRIKV
ncbi:Pro-kumamolisin, activation domain-containing protein [Mycena metata]|uniref:Pro-kumamolisin, activation domain-containing protein n=1 Tax=Mycena metata TaxID=1033252 RepID=A0AAD7HVH9_9AGAR|nr:Pro-kumamolisin, activation domain-containing protein [Mycena metata]